MGKPFVVFRGSEPQSRLSSPDVVNQKGKLHLAGATLPTQSTSPQDALQAAESYFGQVNESFPRQLNGGHGSPRTLLEKLQDETQEPAGFSPTQHRESIGEVLQMKNSKLLTEIESRMSPGQGDIDLEASEFSLDNSYTNPRESMFSPPSELESMISPAQANIDIETRSEFSLDDSDEGPHGSMCSPPMVSASDGVLQKNEEVVQGWNFAIAHGESSKLDGGSLQDNYGESGPQSAENSLESVHLEDSQVVEEMEQRVEDRVSNLEFEWNAVLKRSGRSLDSITHESFKTSRSAGMSSTNSRYSLSDEAISERAAAWGSGVAKLVLKNSSQESTPRTSTASSVDGLSYGQKIPGVSKHVKEALSSFQLAFVVCDVIDPEKPVLFASAGFFHMTGYSPEEVIGRNCRFLQGLDTDAKEVARISSALKKGESYSGTILNYKKNGSPFWNLLTLSPISDDKGVVIKYMGMQAEVKSKTMMARRRKTAIDTTSKDIPRSVSHSIMEEICQPSSPLSKRSEREDDVPIFTLPSTSRVTATHDSNGRSQGSKRYSLTYGLHPRSRSIDLSSGRSVRGSERLSTPSERKRSLAPQQRPAKTSSARPFYWLMTAARILEEEIQQLGCKRSVAKEHSETITRHETRKGGSKKRFKFNQVAKGVVGLYRKLERKVFKRTARAAMSSNQVNAYDHSDSDLEIDDFEEIGNINDIYFGQKDPRCESMPHINLARDGYASNLIMESELRAESNRYFPSATYSNRWHRKSTASNTNEFVLDRKQFCIVHE